MASLVDHSNHPRPGCWFAALGLGCALGLAGCDSSAAKVAAVPVVSAKTNTPTTKDIPSKTSTVSPEPGQPLLDPNAEARLNFKGLPEEKQKRIWDFEHYTFELETKFGGAFMAALKKRDRQKLPEFFREEFRARLTPDTRRETVGRAWWQQASATAADDASQVEGDATSLIERLCAYLADFDTVSSLKLRVLKIMPETEPPAERWRLKLFLAATGTTADGGPISFDSTHQARCVFSSDEDIVAGRILADWREESLVSRRTTQPLMEEVTTAAGLDRLNLRDNWKVDRLHNQTYSTQVAVEDFDRDGFLDIAISSVEGVSPNAPQEIVIQYLLRGDGQSFTDVTEEMGLPRLSEVMTGFATWIDIDNDGYSDLLLGNQLFQNESGKRFIDVTKRSGLRFPYPAMGATVADYDCDGSLDLYVLNRFDPSRQQDTGFLDDNLTGAPNQLWRNTGGGRFVDVTEIAGVGAGNRQSFASAWFHANADPFPDLYVVNDFGRNSLFLNDGKRGFRDATAEAGVGSFSNSMGVAIGDINQNGTPEIYVANMFSKMGRRIIDHVQESDYPPGIFEQIQGACAGNKLYEADSTGRYRETSEALGVNQVGWAHGPAMADFDGDGYLDIYATCGFQSFDRGKPDG